MRRDPRPSHNPPRQALRNNCEFCGPYLPHTYPSLQLSQESPPLQLLESQDFLLLF